MLEERLKAAAKKYGKEHRVRDWAPQDKDAETDFLAGARWVFSTLKSNETAAGDAARDVAHGERLGEVPGEAPAEVPYGPEHPRVNIGRDKAPEYLEVDGQRIVYGYGKNNYVYDGDARRWRREPNHEI